MTYSGSGDTGGAWRNDGGVQPHAFDPVVAAGTVQRRADQAGLCLPDRPGRDRRSPWCSAISSSSCSGCVTLGLGWALFWLAWPASVVWAIVYYGATLGGPHSATIGMRVMDLELRTWYGAPGYFVLGAMHAVLFWVSISFLSPFVRAGRPVQRPPAPAARHRARNRGYQQPRPHPDGATGADILTP